MWLSNIQDCKNFFFLFVLLFTFKHPEVIKNEDIPFLFLSLNYKFLLIKLWGRRKTKNQYRIYNIPSHVGTIWISQAPTHLVTRPKTQQLKV